MYIHERPDWPRFQWRSEALTDLLADVRYRQGRLIGRMEALGFDLQREAVLGTLVADVVKSSDIEGEMLDVAEVRSSVARRLGMDAAGLGRADRDVEGVVEMMLDATQRRHGLDALVSRVPGPRHRREHGGARRGAREGSILGTRERDSHP